MGDFDRFGRYFDHFDWNLDHFGLNFDSILRLDLVFLTHYPLDLAQERGYERVLSWRGDG